MVFMPNGQTMLSVYAKGVDYELRRWHTTPVTALFLVFCIYVRCFDETYTIKEKSGPREEIGG